MKTLTQIITVGLFATLTAFTPSNEKLITKTGHISFYSHTDLEDITANNYQVVSTLDPTSGEVVFSVPMQSFEFEKALMQKHYNSPKFLDTKTYPKAKFKGKFANLSEVDFNKDGSYKVKVSGNLEIHGVSKPISESGTVTVSGDEVSIRAKMNITLADYNIAFKEGKPSTNIAKTIEITIEANYQ